MKIIYVTVHRQQPWILRRRRNISRFSTGQNMSDRSGFFCSIRVLSRPRAWCLTEGSQKQRPGSAVRTNSLAVMAASCAALGDLGRIFCSDRKRLMRRQALSTPAGSQLLARVAITQQLLHKHQRSCRCGEPPGEPFRGQRLRKFF